MVTKENIQVDFTLSTQTLLYRLLNSQLHVFYSTKNVIEFLLSFSVSYLIEIKTEKLNGK